MPRAAAWRKFLQMPGAWAVQGFGMFSVVEKASGRWLGQLGPWKPEGWPGNEVGWAFLRAPGARATRTKRRSAAIDWAFDQLGWAEVIHCIAPGQPASQALAARLGSRNRGPGKLPAPYEDAPIEIWGQTREEWFARRERGDDRRDHRLRLFAFGQLPQAAHAARAARPRVSLDRDRQRARRDAHAANTLRRIRTARCR